MFDRDQLKEQLLNNVVNIKFTKVDGNTRVLKATLNADYLPPVEIAEESTDSVKKINTNTLSVWDIENSGWRSFRIDSIISVEIE